MNRLDPIAALRLKFAHAFVHTFGQEYGAIDPMLRRSVHADIQADFALSLAKRLGKNPRFVAGAVADALGGAEADQILERVEVAGPGFLNLTIRPAYLGAALDYALASDRLGVPFAEERDRVIIDYSSPNVAKEMHVGHLRSTVIGDSLVRTLEYLGHIVIRQNHLGDWGTPFGMLIEHLLDVGESTDDSSVSDLAEFYKAARAKFESNEANFAERARRRVVLLQGGDRETLRLWRTLVDVSTSYFERIYRLLGVRLTNEDICGESFYASRITPLVRELEESGRARIERGALCLFPPGFLNKESEPLPLIVRKQDGGFGYATTDLAAIRYRVSELRATRILYVVGSPQAQHLAMVFAAARSLGWLPENVRAEHVGFGSVLGTDRRMFRSRAGDTARLIDLILAATARARVEVDRRWPEVAESERGKMAHAIGIGAVKYSDLSGQRLKDYVFDLERMVSFEGDSGGYLQYAHARVRSILRKSSTLGGPITLIERPEKELAFELLAFGPTVQTVADTLEPHHMCRYLHGLAARFSEFYDQCQVLGVTEDLQASRVSLCELTARTLSAGLSLVGIEAPERM